MQPFRVVLVDKFTDLLSGVFNTFIIFEVAIILLLGLTLAHYTIIWKTWKVQKMI